MHVSRVSPVLMAVLSGLVITVPVLALMTYSGYTGPTQISGTQYQWTLDVTILTVPDNAICLTYGVEGETPTTMGCTDPGSTPGTWVCSATLPLNSTVSWDISSWSGNCGSMKTQGPSGTVSTYPTAVTMVSFAATPSDLTMLLDWETAAEINTLGFRLYRAESLDGPWSPLNTPLIPGQMSGSPLGAVYRFVDGSVEAGTAYYYRLESVDFSGATAQHALLASGTVPAAPMHRLFLPRVGR